MKNQISYLSIIQRHYSSNVIMVFDSYPYSPTTKGCEQNRRSMKHMSSNINVAENLSVTVAQSAFLSNKTNKKAFIELLRNYLNFHGGIQSLQAEADADGEIVRGGLTSCKAGNNTVVVGQDTDLLVLLIALFKPSDGGDGELYSYCPTLSKKKLPNKVYNIKEEVTRFSAYMCELLLIIHVFSGCDITSAIFYIGKEKLFSQSLVRGSANLRVLLKIFNTPNANDLNITTAGESFFLDIYEADNNKDLNEIRYFRYNRLMKTQSSIPNLISLACHRPKMQQCNIPVELICKCKAGCIPNRILLLPIGAGN